MNPSPRSSNTLRLAAILAVAVSACGTDALLPDDAPGAPADSAEVVSTNTPMPDSVESPLLVLAEFEGSWDGATGEFTITPIASEAADAGLRTVNQPLYCRQRVANDGNPDSNPPDSIELYTEPSSISASATGEEPHPYCLANAVGVGPNAVMTQNLFPVFGVFCANVRVSNYYAAELSDVYVAIDMISEGDEGDYLPYSEGLSTSAAAPPGLTAETVVLPALDGLWSYGDLTPRPDAGSQRSVVWAFRYARPDGFFRFRGRVVARGPTEICGNEEDEDCDGRLDNACGAFGVGTACVANNDCTTGYCDAGFCAGNPCTDGVHNGDETDVDCGGLLCGATCGTGDACNSDADCASGSCRGATGFGTCRAFGPPAAGEVVISEFMAAPTSNPQAEWIEVYNTTDEPQDLTGCELTELTGGGALNSFVLSGNFEIPPHSYFVLARPEAEGEATLLLAADQWGIAGSFALNNDSDTISLRCDGTVIDSVSYSDALVDTIVPGQSAQLDARTLTAVANDNVRNFCAPGNSITDAYVIVAGVPQFGTPGAGNAACIDRTIGYCNLQFPTTPVTGYASQTQTYYGRLYIAGLTDQGLTNWPDSRVAARVGLGTIGTDPATDPSWTWSPMVPNPGYTAPTSEPERNNDEYWGELTLPSTPGGPYEVAVGFSGDGGATWTHCDIDGSTVGGYTSDQAGRIVVEDSPPAPTAAGQVLFTEMMIDAPDAPFSGGMEPGEWIEFHNPGVQSLNLAGCQLANTSVGSPFTLPALVIPPGGYATVGRATGQGYVPTVVWPGLINSNGGMTLTLSCGGVQIDRVAVPGAAEQPFRSLQLRPDRIGATGNDLLAGSNLAYWCVTPRSDNGAIRDTSYGVSLVDTMYGTPNAPNVTCLAIDYCRLDAPTALDGVPNGSSHAVNAQYYSEGTTDISTGVQSHHMLRVQAGLGARDSDPAADPAAWTWVNANAIGGWNGASIGEPNNDGFRGTITAPSAGDATRDYAFRFSGDSGLTWTYCDARVGGSNGSVDGYQVAHAGKLSTPPLWPVTSCSLQYPNPIGQDVGPLYVGDTRTVYGRVRIDGLTNQSSGPNTSSNVIVQFGFGADGAARSSWSYANAAPNAGYSDALVDEYQYTLTLPSAQGAPYDYGFRVSGDNGVTWTDCSGVGDMPVATYAPAWGRIDSFSAPAVVIPGERILVSARSWHGFLLGAPSPNADVRAQVGFGDRGTSPASHASWTWQALSYQGAVGNDWAWAGPAWAPTTTGSKSMVVRFSGDGGATWLYADLIGPTWDPLGSLFGEPAIDFIAPTSGDLVITEMMVDPSQKGDSSGEWFEVYNARNNTIRLDGRLAVASSGDSGFTVPANADVTVGPLGYATFAIASGALDANNDGSPTPSYVYGSRINLNNTSDTLSLTYAGTAIDSVVWSSALGFSIPTGTSLSLSSPTLDNTVSSNWCAAVTTWDTGGSDRGTPGAANPACIVPPLPANSLVITEIYYADPSGDGEWIELFNASASAINFAVNPIEIVEGGGSIAGPINAGVVAPGSFFTITNAAATGFAADFVIPSGPWATGFFGSGGDTVTIRNVDSGLVIDTVTYGEWGNTSGSGRSLQLDVDATTGDNTSQANWCGGLADYDASASTQFGTPGAANHTCALDCNTGVDGDVDGVPDCFETACTGAAGCAVLLSDPWINEIHYDNNGTDANEGFEIAGAAGTNLAGWQVVLYNGANASAATAYATINLSGILPDQSGGGGSLWFARAVDGMQDGPSDGLALLRPGGSVAALLSYEGSFTVAASDANENLRGMTSVDIGANQPSTSPVGHALQTTGTGCRAADFTAWSNVENSRGAINAGQTWSCPPPPVSLGGPCTSDADCVTGAWCPTNTAVRACAPRPVLSGGVTVPFQFVPAGTFSMGSPESELGRSSNETEHPVTLTRNYFVTRTEVTQGQWRALTGGVNPSCFQSTSGTSCTTSNANNSGPVERVDWYSSLAFANALSASEGLSACYTLSGCTDPASGWHDGQHSGCTGASFVGPSCTGYRLLTEAEWEYAARAGTTTATYAGNLVSTACADTTLPAIAWFCGNAGSRTQSVATRTANAWGLSDMLGNVWEWTWDWFAAYPPNAIDPTGPASGTTRVLRGGSWSINALDGRAAFRFFTVPAFRDSSIGFRLARSQP